MRDFDVLIVGSGSGLNVVPTALDQGKTVAVVEKGAMGGTCLNRGCIPSKIIIHSADVMETILRAKEFGIHAKVTKVDFARVTRRASAHVDEEAQQIESSYRGGDNPVLFKGEGRFVGMKTLEVNGERIRAKNVVLAHGCRPTIPDVEGLEGSGYWTSEEALRQTKLPKRLLILGGGYIAAELAHVYGTLGSDVTIVQRRDALLPREDEEVSRAFTRIAAKKFRLLLESQAEKVEKRSKTFRVRVSRKGVKSATIVEADALLVAVGITPNSDMLDVKATGVATDERGYVKVDEYMETNVKGIWALGDCAGKFQFKHSANHESMYVTQSMLFPDQRKKIDYAAMPHAVFASPQIAGAGATEQELKAKKTPYRVAKYPYAQTGMGKALEERHGFVKFLLGDPPGEERAQEGGGHERHGHTHGEHILGVHVIGPDASTLVHEALVAMKSGMTRTVRDIHRTVHIHPALSEVVDRAAGS